MKYCVSCVQPDTRPNLILDENGVCPACNYHQKIKDVDWISRREILSEIIEKYRGTGDGFHDCLMGVSGGKDSTRQAIFLKEQLGLNPLLVCLSYPPDQVSSLGAENLSNLIELGFDVLVSAPAPGVWKELKRLGFEKFTNSFRSTEMALFASVPQIAISHGIELIFWGENPALQLGELATMGKNEYDGNNSREGNTLASGFDWMLESGLDQRRLIPYQYPSRDSFNSANLQIIYLGWFLGDWSLRNNGMYAVSEGFKPRSDAGINTGDPTGVSAIDENHTPVNQLIKYYKFGFGKATEYASEEIRLGRMSRDQAIALVEKLDGALSEKYIEEYCEYLEITEETFWRQIKNSLNKELFYVDSNGEIRRKFKIGEGT